MMWSEAIQDKIKEVFKLIDEDGSDSVSAKELLKFWNTVRAEAKMTPLEVSSAVDDMDTNQVIVLF